MCVYIYYMFVCVTCLRRSPIFVMSIIYHIPMLRNINCFVELLLISMDFECVCVMYVYVKQKRQTSIRE